MKKRIIVYILLALLIIAGSWVYVRGIKTETVGKTYIFDMYYVPVVEYFSAKTNITLDELRKENENRNLVVEIGE
jgi:hypothetical protein